MGELKTGGVEPLRHGARAGKQGVLRHLAEAARSSSDGTRRMAGR